MTTIETELKTNKRQLVIHDGLAFLALLAVTGLLFAVTLFLFKSFSAHRAQIALDSGEAGRVALAQGRPAEAIADLRTALSYAPNERGYELLLAQALGEDGRREEATNYFLNLWEQQPGDGFINLQLARLARQRKQMADAVNYYRASIFGSWTGDGVVHRRDVRLELANYLIEEKEFGLARTELLIAVSNAPPIPELSLALGESLLRAGDEADALKQDEKAFAEKPDYALAYERAGRLAYRMGDYVDARTWLEKALRESAGALDNAADPEGDTTTLLKNSERLLVLDPTRAATRAERVTRTLDDRAIARKRLDACVRQAASANTGAQAFDSLGALAALSARWTAASADSSRDALMRNDADLDLVRGLIGDTEDLTAQLCGAPKGDDALLLLLSHRATNY
jgi:tetratricopeptide (TPR) repeat protein